MKIKNISFSEMVGNSLNFKNNEELKKIVEDIAKFLKLKKYSFNVYNMEIHINTKKYSYDISEKKENKFVIVKEDLYNNKSYNYIEIVG